LLAGAPSPFVVPQPRASAPPPAPAQRIAPWTPPAHLEAGATYGRVIGIVAAIVALIAGLLYVTRGARTARVHFSTVPTDAQVWVDAKRWPASMSPFVIDELEPDVPHRLEVRKDGYLSWSAPLTLASGQILRLPLVTLAPARPAAAPAVAAALALAPAQAAAPAHPGQPTAQPAPADQLNQAETEQPGPEPERTPEPAAATQTPRSPRALPKPKHALAPRAPPKTKEKVAPSGSGLLRINARPWATVSLDGKPIGNTPLIDVKISAGAHTIRLENPQFKLSKTLKVRVNPNETVTRLVDLR
jgi:serine/threonine-protein kinase